MLACIDFRYKCTRRQTCGTRIPDIHAKPQGKNLAEIALFLGVPLDTFEVKQRRSDYRSRVSLGLSSSIIFTYLTIASSLRCLVPSVCTVTRTAHADRTDAWVEMCVRGEVQTQILA